MKTVLFLCTGNYYRSRFAEEVFNFLSPRDCPDWRAISRGVAVDLGSANIGPVARATAEGLRTRGVAFDRAAARFPQQVAITDLAAADHIVALKLSEHLPLIQARFAAWVAASPPGRVEYWHIHDIDFAPPEHALPRIEAHVRDLIERLRSQS